MGGERMLQGEKSREKSKGEKCLLGTMEEPLEEPLGGLAGAPVSEGWEDTGARSHKAVLCGKELME